MFVEVFWDKIELVEEPTTKFVGHSRIYLNANRGSETTFSEMISDFSTQLPGTFAHVLVEVVLVVPGIDNNASGDPEKMDEREVFPWK